MGRNENGPFGRALVRGLIAGLLATGVLAIACSGDGSGSSGGGQSCTSSSQCPHWQCVCNDGFSLGLSECLNHVCANNTVCSSQCKDHGGVKSADEVPTVKDSAECKAFCDKALSLGCPHAECDPYEFCKTDSILCADAKRAQLQCEVDTGTWKCESNGWSENDTCPIQSCSTDAGTD